MPGVTNVLNNATDVRKGSRLQPYSGVRVIVDEEHEFFAGDESGLVLEVENPWGTQQMAQDILAQVLGYEYQPYEATSAVVEPIAEIGDAVSVNGVYGGLYKQDTTFGRTFYSDIAAPEDKQIDHEFQYTPPTERKIVRTRSWAKAQFQVQSEEINARVEQTGGERTSFGWSLVSNAFSLYSGNKEVFKCDSTGITVDGKITARTGFIGNGSSGFTITNTSIYNGKSKFGDTTSANANGVYIGTNGIALGRWSSGSGSSAKYDDAFRVSSSGELVANRATIRGNLTVEKITFASGVTLHGSNITSGTVDTNQLAGEAVKSGNIGGGAVTNGKIGGGAVSSTKLAQAVKDAIEEGHLAKAWIDSISSKRISVNALTVDRLTVKDKTFALDDKTVRWNTRTISGYVITYLGS